jgi:hypothetical protein
MCTEGGLQGLEPLPFCPKPKMCPFSKVGKKIIKEFSNKSFSLHSMLGKSTLFLAFKDKSSLSEYKF